MRTLSPDPETATIADLLGLAAGPAVPAG